MLGIELRSRLGTIWGRKKKLVTSHSIRFTNLRISIDRIGFSSRHNSIVGSLLRDRWLDGDWLGRRGWRARASELDRAAVAALWKRTFGLGLARGSSRASSALITIDRASSVSSVAVLVAGVATGS